MIEYLFVQNRCGKNDISDNCGDELDNVELKEGGQKWETVRKEVSYCWMYDVP